MAELSSLGIKRTETGLIKSGEGVFKGIVVSSHTNGTMKAYDGINNSGRVLVDTFTFPSGSGAYTFADGISFSTGLYLELGGTTPIITVIYT